MFDFLKEVDDDLFLRASLIEHSITKPTVYVEIQAFFHTCFKRILYHNNINFNISYNTDIYITDFLKSREFTRFLTNNIGFTDFNLVRELKDTYRNDHEHSKVANYNKQKVEEYLIAVFKLSKGLYEWEKKKILQQSYDHSYFESFFTTKSQSSEEIQKVLENTKKQLSERDLAIEKLTKEYDCLKNKNIVLQHEADKLNELEESISINSQVKTNLEEDVDNLKRLLVEKEKELDDKTKQVAELSKKNEYSRNDILGFTLPPVEPDGDTFYDKAIRAKRNRDYKLALHIYKEQFIKIGEVYDFDLFNAMYKVAFLDRNYKFAKALVLCMLHYEINYFITNWGMGNFDDFNLHTRVKAHLNSNTEYKMRMNDDENNPLRQFPIPIILVGVYSIGLLRNFILADEAINNYDSFTDSYGVFTPFLKAFEELFRDGKSSSTTNSEICNLLELKLRKTSLSYETFNMALAQLNFKEIMNLSVVEIYEIKNFIGEY